MGHLPVVRVSVRGFRQRRRAFPIGLLAALACAAVWLVAFGTSAQAQGVSGYTEVTGTAVTVPGFTSATGSAACPAGDVVLSGGYTLVGGNMVIETSAPLGANGAISSSTWTVTGFDNGDGQGTFTPYAICASSSMAGYSEASKAQSVNAGSSAQLTETCPAGSVITGGGFAAGSTAPVINESDPTSSSNVSSTTWTVFVDNSGSRTAQSVTTYVVCVSNTISGYSEKLAQSSTAGVVSATCPSGSLVIGGGVFAPGPPNTSVDAPVVQNAAGAFVVSNTSWTVDAASTGGGVIGSIAICAAPLPTVNSLKPSNGPAAGGNTIAVVGSNFTGATAVNFGSTPATSFSVFSSGQINAVVPAGSGAVDVTVTTPGGTSPTVSGDIYKYVPSVTSVSPTSGPTTGGTTVTISGTGFTGATGVSFGGTAATFSVKSSSQISATAPAGAAGTVDITVTTLGGTSATSTNDQYTYVTPPTVTRVSPSSGPATGGTSVTIAGTDFTGATAVSFGGTAASTYTVTSATSITATSPAASGAVDVTVTIPAGGTSATNPNDVFKYVPSVTSVSPASGPTAGGTSITINGTGFTGATAVSFGGTAATTYTVNSSSKITATAPAESAGTVDITVTTPGGTSSTGSGDRYTYANGPTVATISPSSGPTAGGTSVTITGANLANATTVKFGTSVATINSNTATQIVAIAPAGSAGAVDVTVTTAGGTSPSSAADRYTYGGQPTVSSVSPTSGPTLGGTVVTITGTNLANPSAVKFGGSSAAVVTPISPTQITAVSPAGTAGAQDVTVTTPGGTSATSSADRFTFVPPPAVTGVSPSSGPAAGGPSVTITGTDFTSASAVHFGATPAAGFSVDGPTQITATSPAGAGVADVTVTTPSGTSATSTADRFTYNPSNVTPPPSSPVVLTGAPSVHGSGGAALEGSVNPQGLPTTAHYEYGLDSKFRAAGPIYDQSTPSQNVGSDFSSHTVVGSLSGLVPNALYHVRLVTTNSAGTTFGPDATFTTKEDPPPPAPKLGGSFNAQPVNGLVLVEINGKFVPLTEVRQIPNGAIINALHGTLVLITSAGGNGPANVSQAARTKGKKPKVKVTTQKGTFGGAVFKVTQDHSGLATLSLVEGAAFAGAPTYARCQTHSGKATVAALSKKTLQLLHGSDNHGKFRTKGRYAAATVRGTVWSIADRCDGTLTHVTRGTVVVSDLVRRKTITVHAGHSYLALARPPKHK
ncbi:MAG: beta strand repeat-containing protein [Solirubrobacteraceae bacterium]